MPHDCTAAPSAFRDSIARGRPLVLTCTRCNNTHGSLLDSHIKAGRDLRQIVEGRRPTSARLRMADKDIAVTATPGTDGISATEVAGKSDVSVQAAALYDKAAEAVTGRSLRKEDRQLYKNLEGLFRHRNAVAHRADEVQAEQVRADIVTARDAMMWADSLTMLP